MMLIDRVLLIEIHLEELVVLVALEILVPDINVSNQLLP
jgi:hypothetical protein